MTSVFNENGIPHLLTPSVTIPYSVNPAVGPPSSNQKEQANCVLQRFDKYRGSAINSEQCPEGCIYTFGPAFQSPDHLDGLHSISSGGDSSDYEPVNVPLPSSRSTNTCSSIDSAEEEYDGFTRDSSSTQEAHNKRKRNAEAIAQADASLPIWNEPGQIIRSYVERFIENHFLSLDEAGKRLVPDMTKRSEPIALHNIGECVNEVYDHASRAAGLQVCTAGEKYSRVAVLGWSSRGVWHLASTLKVTSYPLESALNILETARKFTAAMAHREPGYQQIHPGQHLKAFLKPSPPVPTDLSRFHGIYVARFKPASSLWNISCTLTLDIHHGPTRNILEGTLTFGKHWTKYGKAEWTLLLAPYRAGLDAYVDGNVADIGRVGGMIDTWLYYRSLVEDSARGELVFDRATFASFRGRGMLPREEGQIKMEGYEC